MTSVLILAGARQEMCPLCTEAGVSSKALIKLAGVRMIDHVLRALRDAPALTGKVYVSGLGPEDIAENAPADLTDFVTRVHGAPSGKGPASATLACLEAGASTPLLITTCDHPLLTPIMIDQFLNGAQAEQSDFSVALATRPVIEAAYPDVARTYIRLGGQGYSGCNLFYLQTEAGKRAIKFWQDVGRDRKRPLKVAHRFGYSVLFRMLMGRLSLKGAFAHGSRRVRAKISPVVLAMAEAAIDVDKPCDLALVRKILDNRVSDTLRSA